MSLLRQVVRELIGMFVADARISLALLAVVALSAVILNLDDGSGLLAEAVLALGSLAVLFHGVLSAARSTSRVRARHRM